MQSEKEKLLQEIENLKMTIRYNAQFKNDV